MPGTVTHIFDEVFNIVVENTEIISLFLTHLRHLYEHFLECLAY